GVARFPGPPFGRDGDDPVTRVPRKATQGRSAAQPPEPFPPEDRSPPRGPEKPPPNPALEAKNGPCLRAWPRHDRHKPPIPPRPTAGTARFRKNLGILKIKPCRDLSRKLRSFFGRGVGVFANLKHPVSRGREERGRGREGN